MNANKTQNKAAEKRIAQIAGSIKSEVDKCGGNYEKLSVAALLRVADYAEVLSSLVLSADTEIKVIE